MAKLVPDAIIDAQLDVAEGDMVHVCSSQPTTFLEATTTFQLASKAIVGGDYAKANGDTSGRKNTLTTPAAAVIDNSGLAQHLAVTLAAGSVLKLVTTVTDQALTAGGTVDVNPFDHEIGDAT